MPLNFQNMQDHHKHLWFVGIIVALLLALGPLGLSKLISQSQVQTTLISFTDALQTSAGTTVQVRGGVNLVFPVGNETAIELVSGSDTLYILCQGCTQSSYARGSVLSIQGTRRDTAIQNGSVFQYIEAAVAGITIVAGAPPITLPPQAQGILNPGNSFFINLVTQLEAHANEQSTPGRTEDDEQEDILNFLERFTTDAGQFF
jgi:hypothetical protein